MITRKRFPALTGFVLASLLCTVTLTAQESAQNETARESRAYSLEGLEGNYAIVGTYAGNIARLIGTATIESGATFEGSATVNIPGPRNTREIVPISYTGTLTVSDDGTGTMFATVNLPNATQKTTLDFVVTKAELIRGVKVATEITTMQREPSGLVAGEFISHVLTRRPK